MTINTLKILVVDDQESIRTVIVHILKELGHHDVRHTGDSKYALQLILKESYDLIISDWHMPHLTGLELLKTIRETKGMENLPVMLVTADNERSHVQEAIKAGVSSFIIKPFSPSEIEKKISHLFPNKRFNEQQEA